MSGGLLYSSDMEAALLGCLLLQPALIPKLDEWGVSDEDWYSPAHAVTAKSIRRVYRATGMVDELAVIADLERHQVPALDGRGQQAAIHIAGGRSSILGLAAATPSVSNAKSYARQILDLSLLRRLLGIGQRLATAGSDPASADRLDEVIDSATTALISLRDKARPGNRFATRQNLAEVFDVWRPEYDAVRLGQREARFLPWPKHLPSLTEHTMGQRVGSVVISSGWTGDGKSWFGLDCSETILLSDPSARVLYVSLEMMGDELLERLIAMGGHSYKELQAARLEPDSFSERVDWVAGDMGRRFQVLTGSTNTDRIEGEIVRARLEGKPYTYVVVDTLNLLDFGGAAQHRRVALESSLARLKNLAMEHNLVVHGQAQLNRPTGDTVPKPTMRNLKETGALEQTASIIVFVHRERSPDGYQLPHGILSLAKGRNSEHTGEIEVQWDRSEYRFMERIRPVTTRRHPQGQTAVA